MMTICTNCGFPIYAKMLIKDDVGSCIATCANKDCHATYRITMISLSPGKPISEAVKLSYGHGYDEHQNHVEFVNRLTEPKSGK